MKKNQFILIFLITILFANCNDKNVISEEFAKTDFVNLTIGEWGAGKRANINSLSEIIDFKILEQNYDNGILTVSIEMIFEDDHANNGNRTNRRDYINGDMIYKKQGENFEFVEFQKGEFDNYFPYPVLDKAKQREYKHLARYKGQHNGREITLVITEELDDKVKVYLDNMPDFEGYFGGNTFAIVGKEGGINEREIRVNFQMPMNESGLYELNKPNMVLKGDLMAGSRNFGLVDLYYDNISYDENYKEDEPKSSTNEVEIEQNVKSSDEDGEERNYEGTIANLPVQLTLKTTGEHECQRGGSAYKGTYFYKKSGADNKISIDGYNCGASVYLTEYVDGKVTGIFSGVFTSEGIEGKWTNEAGNKQFDFNLREK